MLPRRTGYKGIFCHARRACLTFEISAMNSKSRKQVYRCCSGQITVINPVQLKKGKNVKKMYLQSVRGSKKKKNNNQPSKNKLPNTYHITSTGKFIVNQAFKSHPSNWPVFIISQAMVVHRK